MLVVNTINTLFPRMANNNLYPIQLLNDLHNWYPDILYNPSRFRSVQDLLDYIRTGADVNPYTRGLAIYNNWRMPAPASIPPPPPPTMTSPHVAPIAPNTTSIRNPYTSSSIPVVSVPISAIAPSSSSISTPTHTSYTSTTTTAAPTTTPAVAGGAGARYAPQSAVVSVFEYTSDDGMDILPTTNIRASIPLNLSGAPSNNLAAGLLSAFLGSLGSTRLDSFLNQTVVVKPTREQIDNATTLSMTDRTQDDNCAICQDSIDSGQEMRLIKHCGHFFHKECIDTWFDTNVHCPTCRYDIRGPDSDAS